MNYLFCCLVVVLAGVLSACSAPRLKLPASTVKASSASGAGLALPFSQWVNLAFPTKKLTQYQPIFDQGLEQVVAVSDGSASMYRWQLQHPLEGLGRVRFSWKVDNALEGADIADKNADDAPARLVLAFGGDVSQFSLADAALAELTLLLTGEPMPYATLMYVWCAACSSDRVVLHGRTSRIRYIELAAPPEVRHGWQYFDRDVAKDFAWAFGEKLGSLESVGLLSDSDNTGGRASATYGVVSLQLP